MKFNWTSIDNITNEIEAAAHSKIKTISNSNMSSHSIDMPKSVADGSIELFTISNLMYAWIFNCSWNKKVDFDVFDKKLIRLNFGLELDVSMKFSKRNTMDLHRPSWRFINNPFNKAVRETIPRGGRTIWVTLAFEVDYISQIFGQNFLENNHILSKLIEKPESRAVYNEYPIDYRLNQIISNIVSANLSEDIYLNYIQSKIIELMCIAFDHIINHDDSTDLPVKINDRDKKAISLVEDIIINNLSNPPDIRELCLMIGMNRNKLYYGFKHQYDMTIKTFIQEKRLIEAYRLLIETNKPLTEIAFDVGFKHQSSFSNIFKKKYGLSPYTIRKNQTSQ